MDTGHQVFDHQFSEDIGHEYAAYNNPQEDGMVVEQQQMSRANEGDNNDTNANVMVMHAYQVVESEESMLDPAGVKPRAVHQCPVCNKIFVSFKGLQQHAIIHTDQKPYACDICGKSFRFKSNLFEHRSVHTGNTPHQCPVCGKTCRLKGNLKKHLRTHCTTKEELDVAWQPFASHRRAPAEIPQDAIIIRPTNDPNSFTPQCKPKKRKLGLGPDSKPWVEKIQRGDLLPSIPIAEKMQRILDLVKVAEDGGLDMENLYHLARAIPFERYDCPVCKAPYLSRVECQEHIEAEHPTSRKQRPHFCDICLRSFNDRQQLGTHQEHHKRIQLILDNNELDFAEPVIMMPLIEGDEKSVTGQMCEEGEESAVIMDVDGTNSSWEH